MEVAVQMETVPSIWRGCGPDGYGASRRRVCDPDGEGVIQIERVRNRWRGCDPDGDGGMPMERVRYR